MAENPQNLRERIAEASKMIADWRNKAEKLRELLSEGADPDMPDVMYSLITDSWLAGAQGLEDAANEMDIAIKGSDTDVSAASASSWSIGAGYTGIRWDGEIFPVGFYAQATRKINDYMAAVASVNMHGKTEREQTADLSGEVATSFLGAFGGVMLATPLPLDSESSFLYGMAKMGMERFNAKVYYDIPGANFKTSFEDSEYGFAFELGAGLQMSIYRNIALDMSVAYRRANYENYAGNIAFNSFVWYGGMIFRL